MPQWSYRPELDGLRCLAVYAVLVFHAGSATLAGGFIGVDLFFVLSGFLVTQVVWHEVDRDGHLSLGRFWSRRVRRLLPAAIVVVVAVSALTLLVSSQAERTDFLGDARASLLWYANWEFIGDSTDYFGADGEDSPFLHFWSLSIEEQFYLAYPLLLVAALRLRPGPRSAERLVTWSLAAVVAVSASWQLWRAAGDPTYAYYATDTRLYQLAAGALLAMLVRGRSSSQRPARRDDRPNIWATALAAAGLACFLVLTLGAIEVAPSVRGLAATAASVALLAGLQGGSGSVARLLAREPWRYLGQISYATYLWHWPVILLLRDLFDVRPAVLALLAATVATALAALSGVLLEQPLRRLDVAPRLRWPTVSFAVTASLVAAVVVVPAVLGSDRRPAVALEQTGTAAAASMLRGRLDRPVPHDLDLVDAKQDVPARTPPCTADDLEVCRLSDGDGLRVVVVGDSQAQMFLDSFRALADEQDWRLHSSVVAACPWQTELRHRGSTEAQQETCRRAREEFYAEVLPVLDADVVIAIGLSRTAPRWEDLLVDVGGDGERTLSQRQLRTAQETAELVRRAGARLVIAKSLLSTEGFDTTGFDPLECLARADTLAQCAVVPPLGRPVVDGFYETIAALDDGVAAVDLNPVICPGEMVCAPVLGDTIVWRDPDHVTGRVLTERRRHLLELLQGTGQLTATVAASR